MTSLLTPSELAERWKCGRDVIYDAIHSGELKACNIGGWKIEPDDAEQFRAKRFYQPKPKRRRPGPKPKERHLRKIGQPMESATARKS